MEHHEHMLINAYDSTGNSLYKSIELDISEEKKSISILKLIHQNVVFEIICFFVVFLLIFQANGEVISVIFLESIFYGAWAVSMVFAACEFGQRFSIAFNEIDDVVGQTDWYLLPIEIKRMLPIIIINSQQPCALEFFGSLSCSREQFKKVKLFSK